ncbi:MAG TPA: VCBS repeat-containing protein [Bryobacteraceae bacterium]|nr:VCBS repeat-containing protein [Bryobacteraceae bacterium]
MLVWPAPALPVNFNAPQTYLAPSGCTVTADFNGDGKPDMAAMGVATLSTLLSNGDGTFRTLSSALSIVGVCLAEGDFNGDGKPDLVLVGSGTTATNGTIAIMLGNGDGTFALKQTYTLNYVLSFERVAVGDFNGDGKPDLVVTGGGTQGIAILLGNGDGSFQTPQIAYSGAGANYVTTGDFNGDGKLDLAVTNSDGNCVEVFLGVGNGRFRAPQYYATQKAPALLTVADLNGDGKADLAVANSGSNNVSVLIGNGDGTFQPQVFYAAGQAPAAVQAADLNGDGIPDLVVANAGEYQSPFSSLSILLGTRSGGFEAAVQYGPGGQSLTIADFNGDGQPDLAVGNTDTVTILPNLGGAQFAQPVTTPVLKQPGYVAAGDFNGDGKPDLAVANWESNSISVLLNAGGGTFRPAVNYGTLKTPSAIAVADFNGDGNLDLAVSNYTSGAITILLGNGDGTFQPPAYFAAGRGPQSIAVGDFNGDGKPDLAVGSAWQDPVWSGYVSILLGNGDGTFQPVAVVDKGYAPAVAAGDFNRDGKLDILICVGEGATVFPGNGDGTFGSPINTSSEISAPPSAISVADFNGDGNLDFVSAGQVRLGDGTGKFPAVQYLALDGAPAVADFDGDGKLDIAIGTAEGVGIFTGKGNGAFNAPVVFYSAPGTSAAAIPQGANIWTLASADFDGDGKPDIATANWFSADVTVLLNTAP